MGRTNRSRKRREENSKAKKARYEVKELARLKKTLGIMDTDEQMKDLEEVATIKTAKELKIEKKTKEEEQLEFELQEEREQGQSVTVVNEKTGKTHVYNTKTLKDQHGSYPPWFKPKKTAKRMRKRDHARKMKFKQAWTVTNVPL
ncbi:protein LLP homolog [Stomoxys calcitrans]|uniref:Protein LLP homolog n=1 Tax=Stomoxys calcitrans TaxID=35570 RepID=A0A1I8PPU6_STOCA|nr:protein LLP homolog [Stomoxys calcitrans]